MLTVNLARSAMASHKTVPILLRGARVLQPFRDAVFRAANRAGMSVNEFVLNCAARQLRQAGTTVPGVFESGDLDLDFGNDNDDGASRRSATSL